MESARHTKSSGYYYQVYDIHNLQEKYESGQDSKSKESRRKAVSRIISKGKFKRLKYR